MAGFTSYADIATAVSNGQVITRSFCAAATSSVGVDHWRSTWLNTVGNPGAGAVPASAPGTTYTNHADSVHFPDMNPDKKFLLTLGYAGYGALMVLDRLVAVGGINLSTTGTKTMNTATLPRYTGTAAEEVIAFWEVGDTINPKPSVRLNSYTNESGTTGRTGPYHELNSLFYPGPLVPLPLQTGDLGVRAVASLHCDAATSASSGTYSLVLAKPIAMVPSRSAYGGSWCEYDFFGMRSDMPRIFDGASLMFANAGSITTYGIAGIIQVVHG